MGKLKKVEIANTLVSILLDKDDQWINRRNAFYTGLVFSPSDANELEFGNVFVQVTAKKKIFAIGRYEERYYTDENEYYSNFPYFFSFGSVANGSITSIETVTESEFGGGDDLEKLYSKANLSSMNIDIDDIENSFF